MSDDLEKVARAMLVPLGYSADVDWDRTWIGNETDSPEEGTLAYLCRSLALASLRAQPSRDDTEWRAGMQDAANICATLAETTYDDADGFAAATGCEAAIINAVRARKDKQ